VRLELAKVREREGIKRRGISLTVSDEAEEILAELGWHPQFGARPLTRVIEEKVLTIAVELSRKPSLSRLDVRVERAGQELSISFRP
jgi:ATP-dependent Clp protease ATP-binding subunit ClpA